MGSVRSALREWLSLDSEWQRPRPRVGISDVVLAAIVLTLLWVNLEASRTYAMGNLVLHPRWMEYLFMVAATVPLVWRRRHPEAVAAIALVFSLVSSYVIPEVGYTLTFQAIPFVAVFSAVAWSRSRWVHVWIGVPWTVICLVLPFFTVGNTVGLERAHKSLFSVPVAYLLALYTVNICYWFGALAAGQNAWLQARDRALADERGRTIADQSDQLARAAVLDERVRIARELHDMAAHQVSVIGVHAGAARRALGVRPELVEQALSTIETSSREAVNQMRGLVGTLRQGDAETAASPGIEGLAALAEELSDHRVAVRYLVDGDGARLDQVPDSVGLAVYRIVQESIANARRHSTAHQIDVVVRLTDDEVSVEVTNDGRDRQGSAGTGFGQQGMRERVRALGGSIEMGPRTVAGDPAGYRVLAHLPLSRGSSSAGSPSSGAEA